VTDFGRECGRFLMLRKVLIMQFKSLAPVFTFAAYATYFIRPKELGQVILVAKQPDPTSQSSGSENVD
jgi:hypothetical protein